MYVMEPHRPPRRPRPPPFPTYDVKIVAGRRVVIFHERKKDGQKAEEENNNKADPTEALERENDALNSSQTSQGDSSNALEDKTMLAIKAASVPSSRSTNRQNSKSSASVPPHPNYHNGRRLSLSDTFTVKSFEDEHSRYPVLPPLTKSKEATDEDVDYRVQQCIVSVSERAFQVMLREMRKTDRDRDGVLRPEQIEAFMNKFNVPIQGVLPALQKRFEDQDRFQGMTNYEELLRYLNKIQLRNGSTPASQQLPEVSNSKENVQESGNHRQVQRQMSSKPSSFEDRGEARLILDLESAIANSPKFDLEVFRSSLESKDMYGNEQVSKQHVIQAANHAKLSIPRDVFGRWLMASDPINRGIYSIPKLVNFLERSQPNVISRVKTAKQLSKSHTNLSSTTSYHHAKPVEKSSPVANSSNAAVEFPPLVPLSENQKLPERLASSPAPRNLEDLSYLKQALVRSHQEVPGYLSADDVRHVCSSYSAAFQMNISSSRIQEAIGNARIADPGTGLINIGLFCRFLDNALMLNR